MQILYPGTTSIVTPLAKSTPITQASEMPTISAALPHVRDILELASNEQGRAAHLERQMKEMDCVKLPSDIPSLEDGVILRPESLPSRIQSFVKRKEIKEAGMESHRVALEKMKESKEKQHHQQSQEE